MKRPVQAANLVKLGKLHEEEQAPGEARSHMELAEGHLQAAKVKHLPTSVRYLNAYDGIHHIATAALRNLDLRTSNRAGARDITIQALAWTLDARAALMPVLAQSNSIRARIVYDPAASSAVSSQELSALIGALEELLALGRKRVPD